MADANDKGEDGKVEEIDLTTLPDDTDWKAKAQELEQKRREDGIRSRERTKSLREQLAAKVPEKIVEKPDDKLGSRVDAVALKMAGIVEADEKVLFDKWKGETGREAEAIVENPIFKQELEGLRTARKNQEATSNIKGEGDGASIKDDPDYWISRSSKDAKGMPVFPEEMPREMFSKVLDKLSPKTQGNKLKFYNSK